MIAKKNGFTLIEILVVISLSAILVDMIFLIYQKTNKSYEVSTVKSGLYSQNLRTIDIIRKDIKKANSVLTNFDSGTETYSSLDNHSIILQIPKLDNNQAPIPTEYYHVIYRPGPSDPQKLERIEVIDTDTTNRIITRQLSEIIFTPKNNLGINISGNIENTAQISIDLTLAGSFGNQAFQSKLTSNETMRNK